jgi:hypothetical protein
MKIDIKEFWDLNYYNNPTLTDKMIIEATEWRLYKRVCFSDENKNYLV